MSRVQALQHLGRTPVSRLLANKAWQRVTPGVYATGTPTTRHRLWAGHLLGGPDSALGGEAALHVAGVCSEPAVVEVWVSSSQRVARPGFDFRRDGWGRLDHTRGTLPTIRTDEALIDVGQHLDVERWVALLADATRLRTVSLREVERRIRTRPRVAQREMLLDVLADFRGVESTLEWAYLRDVEARHSLPPGSRQVVVSAGTRSDVRYDAFATLVELDGLLHLDEGFRDLDRDNAHATRGEVTLRYGSRDVRGRPCAVARQVADALIARGWTGALRPCPACPEPTS